MVFLRVQARVTYKKMVTGTRADETRVRVSFLAAVRAQHFSRVDSFASIKNELGFPVPSTRVRFLEQCGKACHTTGRQAKTCLNTDLNKAPNVCVVCDELSSVLPPQCT